MSSSSAILMSSSSAILMSSSSAIRKACPNHLSILSLMTSVIEPVVKVSFLILIFCSLSVQVTPLIAYRQRISKTSRDCIYCDCSVQTLAPYIAFGNIRAPYNLAFSLVVMLLLEKVCDMFDINSMHYIVNGDLYHHIKVASA